MTIGARGCQPHGRQIVKYLGYKVKNGARTFKVYL